MGVPGPATPGLLLFVRTPGRPRHRRYDVRPLEELPVEERRQRRMNAKSEDPPPDPEDLLSTGELLDAVRSGDRSAADRLVRRFQTLLSRFLHARLPRHARGLMDTGDIVQDVLQRALARIGEFENRGHGAFWGYLRQIARNRLFEIRRGTIPSTNGAKLDGTDDEPVGADPSPAEGLMNREMEEAYERALGELEPLLREAVLNRLELGLKWGEIARECAFTSADAARMATTRAITRLAGRLVQEGHADE